MATVEILGIPVPGGKPSLVHALEPLQARAMLRKICAWPRSLQHEGPQMSLDLLAWLFTLGVAAHNAEEALLLPAWSKAAGRWHMPVGAREFTFAVVVLTLLLAALAGVAMSAGAQSVWAYLFAGYVFTMVANVFVPHALATLALRRYMPGTATALLFNLPLGGLFLQQAVLQGFIVWPTIAWVAPGVALVIVLSLPVLFAAGRRLFASGGPAGRVDGGEGAARR